jgi:hypothetical protein
MTLIIAMEPREATNDQTELTFRNSVLCQGVDPVARREIWQVISDLVERNGKPIEERPSVILTTHSMEECGTSMIHLVQQAF